MNLTWAYDRGDYRDSHETAVTDPRELEKVLHDIQEQREPVVVTIYADAPVDPDDLPPGLQIGLGHAEHAFAVHITEDGGYLADPQVSPPPRPISFDVAGVPTEVPPEHLTLRPDSAVSAALAFLASNGQSAGFRAA
ncbi:Imm1 family immunity protein [Micromonospora sp. NBC_01796]|uniref:Imm1 family immunity protein n=1 Tax=Micromonospora sp. NBC_01796 TaxID=2975987 RepID=UPI002DDB092A|nr:Imm1 family immunity protein [Micromonospora sp. NBC_01796]WSA86359.1 Imm1 family immunity protein [Micromonospora sp. NBC_01796]